MQKFRLIATLATIVSACSDNVVDPPIEDTYLAVQANGGSLPAMLVTYVTGDGIRLVGGSLTLRAPDTALVVFRTQYVAPSGTADPVVIDTMFAHYQVSGSSLTFTQLGTRPRQLQSAQIMSASDIRVDLVRPYPPSIGLGTYPVQVLFRR